MANLSFDIVALDRASANVIKIADAFDKFARKLDALDKKVAEPKLKADAKEGEFVILKFLKQLEKVDGKEATAVIRARMDKSVGDSIVHLERLGGALAKLSIPVALGAAAPQLVSMAAAAAQAAGALYLLPAAAAAGLSVFLALSLGTKGFGDTLSALADGDVEKFNEALAKLSPQARATAIALRNVKPAFDVMQLGVQDALFRGLSTTVTTLAGTYLPILSTGLIGTAGSLNLTAAGIAAVLMRGSSIASLTTIFANVNGAMSALTPAGAAIVALLLDIANVGSTFLPGLASGFTSAAQGAAAFIARARETGQLATWISNGIAVIRDLTMTMVRFGQITDAVFTAAGADGVGFAANLLSIADRTRAWVESARGQQEIATVFANLRALGAALVPILGLIAATAIHFLNTFGPALPSVAQAFAAVAIAAQPLLSALSELVATVLPPLANLITFLAPALGPMVGIAVALAAAWRVYSTVVTIVTIATELWAGKQLILNAVLAANPIGLIVVAIAALVAGLIYAWNHSETFRKIVTGAWEAVKAAAMAVVGFFASLPGRIGAIFSAIGNGIVSAWNSVVAFVTGIPAAIGGALSALGSAIASGASAAWSWLTTTASNAITATLSFLSTLPQRIATGLGFLAGQLFMAAVTAWARFTAGITTAWDATYAFVVALPGRIVAGLVALGAWLRSTAVSAWGAFTSGIATAWNATWAFVVALPGRIVAGLVALGAWLRSTAVSAWSQFTAGVSSAWAATWAFVVALPGRIVAGLVALGAMLRGAAVTAWSGFTGGIASAWNATAAFFASLPGRIGGFFSNAGSWLLSVGGDIIDGLVGGLTSAAAAVFTFFAGLVANFLNGFKSALGIASPSTVFAQFGQNILQGLINGLQALLSALLAIGQTVWNGLVAVFQAGIDIAKAVWSTFWSGLTTVVTTVFTAIRSFVTGTLTAIQAIFSTVLAIIQAIFSGSFEGMRSAAMAIWGAIQAYFASAFATFQAFWSSVWSAVSGVFSSIWSGIQSTVVAVWTAIAAFFTAAFAAYQAMWSTLWNGALSVFQTTWSAVQSTAVTIWNAIVAFFTAAFAAYQAAFSLVWNTVLNVFRTIWTTIQTTALTIWNAIVAFFTAAFAAYQAAFSLVWNTVLNVFRTIWTTIQTTALTIWNAIAAFFTAAFAAYQATFSAVWSAILSFFTTTWTNLQAVAQNAWNAISAFFQGAFASFSTYFSNTWQGIVSTFERIWSSLSGIAQRVWDNVRGTFVGGINAVIDVISKFAGAINAVAGAVGIQLNLNVARLNGGGMVTGSAGGNVVGGNLSGIGGGIARGLARGGGVDITRGGMLPGYTPGRDIYPALAGSQRYMLGGGEYVTQARATRAIETAQPGGMSLVNNAHRRPVDIIPRRTNRGPAAVGRAFGGPVGPNTLSGNVGPQQTVLGHPVADRIASRHGAFLQALADGQAEAVQALEVYGGSVGRFLRNLDSGQSVAKKAAGGVRARTPEYGAALLAAPIFRDLGGAIAVARSMNGKPYIWGGAGPGGADCSGYQSIITNALRNAANPFSRVGTTATFPWSGFTPGLTSAYAVGAFKGNPGHMAGTLAGVNVESGGRHGNVAYGGPAAGADSGQFGIKASLPQVGGVFAPGGGGGGGISLEGMARAALEPIKRAIRAAGEPFGFTGKFGAESLCKILDGIITKAASVFGGGGGGGSAVAGGGPVQDIVRRTAAQFGWDQGPQWDALAWIISRESGWNPNAQNPNSTAYGLFQFLNGTWASTGVAKSADPAQQALAGMRYFQNRYRDPIGAKAFWESHGWYANGAVISKPTFGMIGEAGPEVILPVNRPQRADSLMRQAGFGDGTDGDALSNSGVEQRLDALTALLERRGAAATVNIYESNNPRESGRSAVLALRMA